MLDTHQIFANEESDFFFYMMDKQLFSNKRTYHDYISRLRYVSQFYPIDKTLTKERVAEIVKDLKDTAPNRTKYNTSKGISDITSGLKRFLEYVQSDYLKQLSQTILSEETKINNNANLSSTEKEALVKSRIGQGRFRDSLIAYWNGCSVTSCEAIPILVASHIKPWRKSDNTQRLDVYNGLLLTPNLDKLFDRGYISFDDKGKLICSDALPQRDMKILGASPSMSLTRIEDRHKAYLAFHRDNCLL